MKNLMAYTKRLKKAKSQVKSALNALRNQKVIKGKSKKKIVKLEKILNNLKQVLSILENTEKDIGNTLAVIRKAAAAFKN